MADQHRLWLLGGGIGSGKSTVRRILAELGVATVDADGLGHEVLEPDGPAHDEVAATWPEVVVKGRVDRARLARIVFDDPAQLDRLEQITHPHIFGLIRARVQEFSGVVVVEMPLPSPALGEDWRRMVVDCSDELRLERSVARGMTPSDVDARMRSQPSREEWLANADLVVPNHGSEEKLREAVFMLASYISSGSWDKAARTPQDVDGG